VTEGLRFGNTSARHRLPRCALTSGVLGTLLVLLAITRYTHYQKDTERVCTISLRLEFVHPASSLSRNFANCCSYDTAWKAGKSYLSPSFTGSGDES
jgi:hypothetical protein